MATPRLGRVQLQIMQTLWRRGPLTARQITDEIARLDSSAGASARPLAHSTIQTLLRKMETKGAITHEPSPSDARTFVFRPLHEQTDVTTTVARDLLARVFDGSISGLVAHLLKYERVSPDELTRLRQLIDEVDDEKEKETRP